ncbi:hypothetical protein B0T14DRAFT_562999 [Immersiella caudata]|uniref:Uncharacterized protein n=1 Tax=Immersiella caudata TaxID=314043 RepID=A0AA40C6P4_9PEZI|nr:hypothetical protein B0T14DRAFT_562999 [Immersiella caudata]
MARRRRTRTQEQKDYRRFTDRNKTGQAKVDGLNDIPGGRAILISSFRGKAWTWGDQRLLRDLGYARVHPSRSRSTSSTDSTFSASSKSAPSASSASSASPALCLPQVRSETAVAPFNGNVPSFQQVSAAPEGLNQRLWTKEVIDFFAMDFFAN